MIHALVVNLCKERESLRRVSDDIDERCRILLILGANIVYSKSQIENAISAKTSLSAASERFPMRENAMKNVVFLKHMEGS